MNSFIADSSQQAHDLTFHLIHRDYPRLHTHDYWEFLVIVSGVYKHTLNGETSVVNKNQAFLIRPQDCHSLVYVSSSSDGQSNLNILIRESLVKEVCSFLSEGLYEQLTTAQKLPILLENSHLKELFNYTSLLQMYLHDDEKYDLLSRMIVFYILEKIVKLNQFTDKDKPEWLRNLLQEINSSETCCFTIENLLEKTNYSHSYFTRQFTKYMGVSPIKYLTEMKMVRAGNFLIHSNMSIIEIAFALGYTNLSHFNHTFKEYYQISPTQYRKEHQNLH